MFFLFNIIFACIAAGLDNVLGTTISLGEMPAGYEGMQSLPYGYIYMLYGLIMFLPSISVAVRRLQDTSRSGWWMLVMFIPCIGLILIYFLVLDSTPGDNEYGPNPKGVESIST